MTKMRLILLLILLLAGALIYAYMETPRQRRVTGVATSRPSRPPVDSLRVAEQIDDLDFSGGTSNVYQKPQRNLFAALYFPPPIQKKKPSVKPKPKVLKSPSKRIPPVFVAPKPTGPPPMKALKVLGHLQKEEGRSVFLATENGEIYVVKQGDRFAENLEVAKLSAKELVIKNNKTGQQLRQLIKTATTQRLPRNNFKSGRPSSAIPAVKPVKQQGDEK